MVDKTMDTSDASKDVQPKNQTTVSYFIFLELEKTYFFR